MKAKKILEDAYDIVLSRKASYSEQMDGLNRSGKFGNTFPLAVVVFKLCEIIDAQQEEIESLYARNTQQAKPNPDIIV